MERNGSCSIPKGRPDKKNCHMETGVDTITLLVFVDGFAASAVCFLLTKFYALSTHRWMFAA
jgi:hypothetical protein